jgi:hypothetical protein
MKYLIIIGLILSCIVRSNGQTPLLSGNTFVILDAAAVSHVYKASVTRTSKDRFNIELNYSGGAAQSFTISPLDLATFRVGFITAITAAVTAAGGPLAMVNTRINGANLQNAASILHNSIVVQNRLNPPAAVGPKAGDFYVKDQVPVYATLYVNSVNINAKCPDLAVSAAVPVVASVAPSLICTTVKAATPLVKVMANSFNVREVEIVIHNGFINNIRGVVVIGGNEYIFTNPIPIGISSSRNINSFNKYYLRCYDKVPCRVPSVDLLKPGGRIDYVINLGDLLKYVPDLTRNVFDKSPRNAKHTIAVKGSPTTHTVYKEPVSRLIQASVFSDFIGIDETKPNGLIQTELYRRMNLHTVRNQLWGSKDINWGVFQYLRPEVTISKVEDKERVLDLDYLKTNINGKEQTHAYASSIDLHLYQYMRAGSLFNLALFQNPHLHTTIEFNTGFYFGLVPLKDSLRLNSIGLPENNEYTAVTFETFLEGNIKFSMDKYFGFSMSYTPFVIVGLGKYYNQIKDRDNFVANLEQGDFWDRSFLGKAELLVWVKPAPDKSNGRFFGRYRFIHQLSNLNLSYHQIQVGYSFYLEIPRPKS